MAPKSGARTVLVVLALVVVAGCGDEPEPEWLAEAAQPVVELPPLPGPGAPLLDGFVVPEGAELIGGVLPLVQSTYAGQYPESSWTADLVVDGDPRVVVDDFLDQAIAQGLEVKSNCEVRPDRIECGAQARRLVDGFEEEQVRFRAIRSSTAHQGGISYERWPAGLVEPLGHPWNDDQSERWTPPEPWVPPPLEPSGSIPGPGEPFAPAEDQVGEPLLTVAEGAAVVQPVDVDHCITGGFFARLLVPGDVEPVLAHYEDQFAEWDGFERSFARETIQGIETIRLTGYASGAGDITFTAVVGHGGDPTWATVSRCND